MEGHENLQAATTFEQHTTAVSTGIQHEPPYAPQTGRSISQMLIDKRRLWGYACGYGERIKERCRLDVTKPRCGGCVAPFALHYRPIETKIYQPPNAVCMAGCHIGGLCSQCAKFKGEIASSPSPGSTPDFPPQTFFRHTDNSVLAIKPRLMLSATLFLSSHHVSNAVQMPAPLPTQLRQRPLYALSHCNASTTPTTTSPVYPLTPRRHAIQRPSMYAFTLQSATPIAPKHTHSSRAFIADMPLWCLLYY
ncbi:hypothetical protein K438DRAFT_1780664 [Mycena galopus ATCC 62051]|nr:hypothetical protein K438DRAFT_1780664 [Mycena galopus ATCC 62051]